MLSTVVEFLGLGVMLKVSVLESLASLDLVEHVELYKTCVDPVVSLAEVVGIELEESVARARLERERRTTNMASILAHISP